MRVLYRGAGFQKEADAIGNRQKPLVTVLVESLPVHILHHQVRIARAAEAAVQQSRDIRMIEAGQDLAFGAKALGEEPRTQVGTDHFDRDLLLKFAVRAVRQVDRSHAALPEFGIEFVSSDGFSQPPLGLHRTRWQSELLFVLESRSEERRVGKE